jgi:hypothetical protein
MVMGWILEFPLSPWERVGVRVFFVKYPHPPFGHLLLEGEGVTSFFLFRSARRRDTLLEGEGTS